MPRTILVTGGAGYIGSHTVAALLEQKSETDIQVVVVDNLYNAVRLPGEKKPESLKRIEEMTHKTVVFYECDIRDKVALSKIFETHNIESVIHFAALKAVGESVQKPLEYYQVNVHGTCTLLEVMRNFGVYKIVYSSSCTVYGSPEKLPLDESHVTGRGMTSPYGKTKYFCEEIMTDLCVSSNKWQVVSLRYFNPIGAHSSGRIGEDSADIPNNLMPYISQVAIGRLPELRVFGNDYPTADGTGVRDYIHVVDLAEGHIRAQVVRPDSTNVPSVSIRVAIGRLPELRVFGNDYPTADGTGVRDYIHVVDLAEGHIRALKLFDKPGFEGFHAINLGTGTGYSVLQMIKAFEAASGRKVPYKIVGRRAGDIAENYANVSLSQRLLEWRATRTLDDMCRDTWNWQSQNPQGYRKVN